MAIQRISRSHYHALRQDELANYAGNIVARCMGNPAYAAQEPLLGELQTAIQTYNEALVAARSRAIDSVATKRQARKKVLDLLDRIVHSLEFDAPDELHVINAGMRPIARRQIRTADLPAPVALQVLPTGNRSEILLQLTLPDPRQVQTNAVEYSADHGEHWTNGTYSKRSRILLTGLPSRQELLFRVRSIGTRGRVSAWSAPVAQIVL